MKHMRPVVLAVAAVLAAFAPVAAQRQPEPPLRIRLTPFAGAGVAASDLPASFLVSGGAGGDVRLDDAAVDDAAAFGASLGVRFGRTWALEGTFAYAPSDVEATVGGEPLTTEADVFFASADVLWYAPVGRSRIEPYLSAGLGAKVSDSAIEDAAAETDLALGFGGGAEVRLAPMLALRLDARDRMSWVDPEIAELDAELRHDLLLTAGLTFTLPLHARRGGRR